MAESSEIAVLLRQARHVFAQVNTIVNASRSEFLTGNSREVGFEEYPDKNYAYLINEVRQSFAGLQNAMHGPPDGFEEVAEQLSQLANILEDNSDGRQQTTDATESILTDLIAFDMGDRGRLAVREAIMRFPDALAANSDWFFTSLNAYAANTRGNLGFLEMVRDEVCDAAKSKRQRIDRQYTNATLLQMVEGIKWSEARLRITLLGDLPADLVDQASKVLRRELTVGTVEQICELFTPVVGALRDAYEDATTANQDHHSARVTPDSERAESSGNPSPSAAAFAGLGNAAQSDDEAEATKPTGTTSKSEQRAKWLAQAMLLVRDNPGLSDAEIARRVGKDKSTLSRSREYQNAAAMSRGVTGDRNRGHITVDPESGLRDVEAYSDDSAERDLDD